jgi:hypothetical protein
MLNAAMLSVIRLNISVVTLIVIRLSVIIQSGIMLSVIMKRVAASHGIDRKGGCQSIKLFATELYETLSA